jgi:hypothetical protein
MPSARLAIDAVSTTRSLGPSKTRSAAVLTSCSRRKYRQNFHPSSPGSKLDLRK